MPQPLQVVLCGVRVTCDMGYLCANFSFPRPLCSRLTPDVRNRQTDVRQTDIRRASSLNAPGHRGRGYNNSSRYLASRYTKYITGKLTNEQTY